MQVEETKRTPNELLTPNQLGVIIRIIEPYTKKGYMLHRIENVPTVTKVDKVKNRTNHLEIYLRKNLEKKNGEKIIKVDALK